jgi:hypothetical protein
MPGRRLWKLAERAGCEVTKSIRRGVGGEGDWSAVVRDALYLTSLSSSKELAAEFAKLRELAELA